MRRHLLPVLLLAAALAGGAVAPAFAQDDGPGGGGDQGSGDAPKKGKKDEWEDKQAPLRGLRNAGPCPLVKVLYDAGRYMEFQGGQESSATAGFTGEIQGVSSGCRYMKDEPIHLEMEILFALGRGPAAAGSDKNYSYWVAVTDRNRAVLAKEYFTLPVKFPSGQDRVMITDRVSTIDIPRANDNVSGANFEVLVGFDVTPQMVQFNRLGKRFRANAVGVATSSPPPSQ